MKTSPSYWFSWILQGGCGVLKILFIRVQMASSTDEKPPLFKVPLVHWLLKHGTFFKNQCDLIWGPSGPLAVHCGIWLWSNGWALGCPGGWDACHTSSLPPEWMDQTFQRPLSTAQIDSAYWDKWALTLFSRSSDRIAKCQEESREWHKTGR